MSGHNTMSSLLVSLQQTPLLLPMACVVEVLDYTRPASISTDNDWLLGSIHWHGKKIPIVSFELLNHRQFTEFSASNKIMVVRRTTEQGVIPFYGVVTQGLPKPIELSKEEVSISAEQPRPAEKMQVLYKEVSAVLPDLGYLEEKLSEGMALAPITP